MLDIAVQETQRSIYTPPVNKKERELNDLIAITKPYYAIGDVEISSKGFLSAEFQTQLKNHNEVRGINLSEAFRYLETLGSVALAKSNPRKEKHYYLATDAVIIRKHKFPVLSDNIKAIVKTHSFGNNHGTIVGQILTEDYDVIYEAEIHYEVLHKHVFENIFRNQRLEIGNFHLGNPYTLPARFYTEYVSSEGCKAQIGIVTKEDCAGHFNNFPALPVPRIGGAMADLSGFQYNVLRGADDKFCIRKAVLHAESFIFAGERVELETRLIKNNQETEIQINSVARTNSCNSAVEMSCWFF
jgi:hypothetical protein